MVTRAASRGGRYAGHPLAFAPARDYGRDMSDVYPSESGRCPRCKADGQGGHVFCSDCSLRLQPGMFDLEGRANLASAGWMQSNRDLADAWRCRLEERDTETVSQIAVRESNALRHQELQGALAELDKWALRARLLGQVASEAYERAMQAYRRAERADADPTELARRLGGASAGDLPALPLARPGPAAGSGSGPRAVAGGGFIFYAESGIDADADGDVDGGLLDRITGDETNDGDGVSGLLGDLFGG